MSNPEYNRIASQYKAAKQQTWRSAVEENTLFSLLPDLSQLSILDIACGDGIYTRKLKKLGAKNIIGVDISSNMIHLAQQEENRNPLGIRYEVGDASQLEYNKKYDIIFASYLFNYARSQEELATYCNSIFQSLKPGGQLIGMNDNPQNLPKDYHRYKKYGFIKSCPPERVEGSPINYTIYNSDGSSFSFDNYYLSSDTYKKTFTTAGFKNFQWVQPFLSDDPQITGDINFWDDFINQAPVVALQAIRPQITSDS